ncbi:hypothetical protein [Vallitalea sp.]|uniref:hypothetical protein n=1 Tax=Vallitalea sp. TaxID=1882829 RepID=UPI0025DB3F97|nr:hypothetical protein [Vallitalea sp.]MCT4686633.1 hypothetical protein [Vallitalea sp.]
MKKDFLILLHMRIVLILFLGDCIYGGMYKGVYGYTREKLFPMIDEIFDCDADHYIVSHENIFDKEGITDLLNQLKTAGEVVGK